jgi:lysophospholipase
MKRFILFVLIVTAPQLFAINEAGFETTYQQKVVPWFTSARAVGELRTPDGVTLRWFAIESPSERAAVVVLPGWMEMAEYFAEELYDLRDLDLSFYVLDYRCQGLSSGGIEPRDRWYLKDWRSLLSDSEMFFEKVVRSRPHRKIVLYGNSMGGALATVFLARHSEAAQTLLLSVPAFGIKAPVPPFMVIAAARLLMLFGQDAAYLPGQGPYRREPFDGNKWSIASRTRYEMLDRLIQSRTEYQMGGTTVRGVLELVRLSREALQNAKNVKVPTLLIQAGRDTVVLDNEQDVAASEIRDCRKVVVADAHHVIMQETDRVRNQALAAIRSFLLEQTR